MEKTLDDILAFQQIKQLIPLPDLQMEPQFPGSLWIPNMVFRVVNVDLDMVTGNKVYADTVDDGGADLGEFPGLAKRIDIHCVDYALDVTLTDAWEKELNTFYIPTDVWITLDIAAISAVVACHVAAQESIYQLIVWL